ncbi:Coatomer epsilon subunit [Selenomonas ruminantium]|uniref:Coatomer epsilon subunit n=2 Tax=Selenomonas ruminantium TaxID=971 RepID=A0A1I0YKD3_SELRU|nr:Coatomer epsilon subunit [Selenomonas ruminantium]
MGKHSKNIKKNRQERKAAEEKQAIKVYLDRLKAQIEEEEYAIVIEILAEMISKKYINPEAMYYGAYSYYMLDDYKRAADWVDNVLHYAPNHLQARLLLAKLCEHDGRWADVFAIYEIILKNWQRKLSAEEQEEIRDTLEDAEYGGRNIDAGKYPCLTEFCHKETEKVYVPVSDISQPSVPTETKTAIPTAAENRDNVLQSNIPLQEKVRLLNVFAAGYFLERDYSAAEMLLQAALKIDGGSQETLRNMIVLQDYMGNEEIKQKFLAKLAVPDFLLLAFLNK